MGQPNTKEHKGAKRVNNDGNAFFTGVTGGGPNKRSVGMRSSAVRENILQQREQYRDFSSEGVVTASEASAYRKQKAGGTGDDGEASLKYPVVLRYAGKDVRSFLAKRDKLYVIVESLGWKRLPMTASEDSFYVVVDLPPGIQRYRFVVNDREMVDATQPIKTHGPQDSQSAGDNRGSSCKEEAPANVLCVNESILMTKEDEEVLDDGEGWGQEEVIPQEDRKFPPIMPVHLRYTPLNTPPTAARCARDGSVCVADDDAVAPENLPIPLNVTVNHVYFQRREDHAVMGLTTRCCNKYTTIVYYSKVEPLRTS